MIDGRSDVIHLGRVLRRQLVERVALGLLRETRADLAPDLFQPPAAATLEIAAEVKTTAFDGLKDVVERDVFRRAGERVTALVAAPADDEAVRAQLAEDLREEVGGHG